LSGLVGRVTLEDLCGIIFDVKHHTSELEFSLNKHTFDVREISSHALLRLTRSELQTVHHQVIERCNGRILEIEDVTREEAAAIPVNSSGGNVIVSSGTET